jgi:acyl carrier protein
MLVNVIEDEFGIQIDFDRLAELDSFGRIHQYLSVEASVS